MEWHCSGCRRRKVVVDLSGDQPRIVGCLNCDWDKALEDELRCTAATVASRSRANGGQRCSQSAVIAGRCWRHSKSDMLHRDIYRYFRKYREDDDLPRLYRVIFDQALKDAGIVVADERHGIQLRQRANELRATPTRGPSVVYFVEREGLIKIGVTTNLAKRLKDIGKGSGMPPGMTVGPVVLLATESGDRVVEQQLHRKFRKTRVSGEWFKPSKALRNYIDDMVRIQSNEDHFMRRVAAS